MGERFVRTCLGPEAQMEGTTGLGIPTAGLKWLERLDCCALEGNSWSTDQTLKTEVF
jgi:hypothetical protein